LCFKTICLTENFMSEFASFRSIIDLWKTRAECASDVGHGATASQVSKWWQRDSVPGEWWLPLVASETARTAGLSLELLATLAARPPVGAIDPADAIDEARP
jgi:hypothetical protein